MFGLLARKLGRFCVIHYYGHVQIDGARKIPQTGPVLLCANHPNSLLDPILVGCVAGRPVRFLAKAPLFDVPVMGNLMRALGMIPAFRGRDSARDVGRNTASLDQATCVLLEEGAVGIFPEGLSHDRIGVEMVRSGAARMALSACGKNLKGLRIVPLGMNYEQKERFRSDVWIQVGDLIDMDHWSRDRDGTPKQLQRQLTDEIDRRLKKCVIHLDTTSWEPYLLTVETMLKGAPVATGWGAIPTDDSLVRRKAIADSVNQFIAVDADRGQQLCEQFRELESILKDNGVELLDFAKLMTSRKASFVFNAVWQVLMFPFAVLGTIHHIVPFTIVRALSKRFHSRNKRTDVSLYRLLLSIPIYLIAYAVIGFLLARGTSNSTAIAWLSLAPFAGVVALEYWPALARFIKRWRLRRQSFKQGTPFNQAVKKFRRLSRELREIISSTDPGN